MRRYPSVVITGTLLLVVRRARVLLHKGGIDCSYSIDLLLIAVSLINTLIKPVFLNFSFESYAIIVGAVHYVCDPILKVGICYWLQDESR